MVGFPVFQSQTKISTYYSWFMFQVDVKKLKYYYMEDDGGSFLISPVDSQIKEAIRKVTIYLGRTNELY